MSSVAQLYTADTFSALLAVSATASVAYSYRYSIVRQGLLGYSYLKRAFGKGPFRAPLLNAETLANDRTPAPVCAGENDKTAEAQDIGIRLFPHVEQVICHYNEDTPPLPEAQEEALRLAVVQWRAVPIDGICQHISLYDTLRAAFCQHWQTEAFPASVTVTCDTMLMELTHAMPIVTMSADDGTTVRLAPKCTNQLLWPTEAIVVDPSEYPISNSVGAFDREHEDSQTDVGPNAVDVSDRTSMSRASVSVEA